MKKEFEKNLKSKRNILKGIGILEITGGVTGLGLILWLLLQGKNTNTYVFLILLFSIGFYIYSIYAGIKLFKHKENSVLHSIILQFIQILGISIDGLTYIMTSGGYIFLGYNFAEGEINFSFAIASKFQINIMNSDQSSFVYVNLLAIIILVLIEKSLSIIKEQIIIKENYDKNMSEFLTRNEKSQLPTTAHMQ